MDFFYFYHILIICNHINDIKFSFELMIDYKCVLDEKKVILNGRSQV